ncbi:hypothetical protein, partial [Flavobacterium sp.]|uniref:hypothetical protein n=1 Tax=Flavobacterium sp. TaxID=239 RepID=UPI0025BEB491
QHFSPPTTKKNFVTSCLRAFVSASAAQKAQKKPPEVPNERSGNALVESQKSKVESRKGVRSV